MSALPSGTPRKAGARFSPARTTSLGGARCPQFARWDRASSVTTSVKGLAVTPVARIRGEELEPYRDERFGVRDQAPEGLAPGPSGAPAEPRGSRISTRVPGSAGCQAMLALS